MTRGQLFLALCLCCGAAAGGLAGDGLDQPPRGAVYGAPEAVAWADHTLGTNIDGGRLGPAAREAFFRQAQWGQPNSLRWLRVPIRWADVQKSPPKEGSATASDDDWSGLDTFLAEAESRGFKVWAVLGDSPVWARDPQQPASAPPKDGRAFGAFARVVATRYRSKIAAYQIWDEPNLAWGWGGQSPDPAAYAGLLREAAINIRAADPRAIIVSAALSPTTENGPLNLNEPEYLRRLYRAGARDFLDAVAAAPFGFWPDPAARRIPA
ncbi:MAG: hypothetical protein HYR71_02715, partial [Chloroflexi bacterium]|nr:hypothetical protein [Chloroflexota bacterium]